MEAAIHLTINWMYSNTAATDPHASGVVDLPNGSYRASDSTGSGNPSGEATSNGVMPSESTETDEMLFSVFFDEDSEDEEKTGVEESSQGTETGMYST